MQHDIADCGKDDGAAETLSHIPMRLESRKLGYGGMEYRLVVIEIRLTCGAKAARPTK
jgi:hypothetical protein